MKNAIGLCCIAAAPRFLIFLSSAMLVSLGHDGAFALLTPGQSCVVVRLESVAEFEPSNKTQSNPTTWKLHKIKLLQTRAVNRRPSAVTSSATTNTLYGRGASRLALPFHGVWRISYVDQSIRVDSSSCSLWKAPATAHTREHEYIWHRND